MIIALTGLAGSGKNTVANMIRLAAGAPVAEIAFAEPLKRFCAEVFGFTQQELYGSSAQRETPSRHFTRPDGQALTPRFALQTLGTEWGRSCDVDVWAKSGIRRAQRAALDCEHVVITDLRFVNEARIVREAGGAVWRIRRHAHTAGPAANVHASEADVWSPAMGAYVTREISNVGVLIPDLRDAVIAALAATLPHAR